MLIIIDDCQGARCVMDMQPSTAPTLIASQRHFFLFYSLLFFHCIVYCPSLCQAVSLVPYC